MDADDAIKADKFAFGRMWDRSAHPFNGRWVNASAQGEKQFSSSLGGMDTDAIAGLSKNGVCVNIFICVVSVFICVVSAVTLAVFI